MASVRKVDIIGVFVESWDILKGNVIALFVCGLIVIMPSFIIMMIASLISGVSSFATSFFNKGELSAEQAKVLFSLIVVEVALRIVGAFISAWLGAGMVRFLLKLVRREKPSYFELFIFDIGLLIKLVVLMFVVLVAAIGYFVITVTPPTVGLWFLLNSDLQSAPSHPFLFLGGYFSILLGAILIFMILKLFFAQILFITIDRRVWAINAFISSFKMIRGNFINLFLLTLCGGVIYCILTLFTCFLGIFILAPWFCLLTTIFYTRIAEPYYNPSPDSPEPAVK